MPLIVISGLPSSGKTRRARELEQFFTTKEKKVIVVSENVAVPKANFTKNEFFANSQSEKMIRSELKSEVIRLLNKDEVVILDAGNYIKGYRYELFCATKANRGTQCTVFCGIQEELAWQFNSQRSATDSVSETESTKLDNSDVPYTRDIFDALCLRYEEPNGNCRWDKPLFVVFPDDDLNVNDIYSALFESAPLPPNKSTQNAPLSATNYLFDMDRLTQEIISDILSSHKVGIFGPLAVKGCTAKVDIPSNVNAIQLNRLRRQFINYSKMHSTTSTLDKVPQLFVQFLNSNCNA